MQTEHLVSNSHLTGIEVNVFQTGYIVHCQRHIFLNQSRFLFSAYQLIIREATQFDIAGVIDDALELFDTFHELDNHLMIDFLRGYSPSAES